MLQFSPLSAEAAKVLFTALQAIKPNMRVAVVGSRNFPCLSWITEFINNLPASCTVVSGGARGVDHAAENAALARGLEVSVFPYEGQLGKQGGISRNIKLINSSDVVVVFRALGESRGSDHAISVARKAGLPLFIVYPQEEHTQLSLF